MHSKTNHKYFLLGLVILLSALVQISCSSSSSSTARQGGLANLDYPIVYVRYPEFNPSDWKRTFVTIPEGEFPYRISPGADLILLQPDGTKTVLVDCTDCSVMDPYISHDGSTVYYALIENADHEAPRTFDEFPESYIYKMNLKDGLFQPIRLTFNDGFPSLQYAGNKNDHANDYGQWFKIRDYSPIPLSDGRLLFTSNRTATIGFKPGTVGADRPVQQLFVMDDHDGTAVTNELSNMRLLETGSLHMVEHPMQLKDGRILFSSWHDAGTKHEYAMTNLMTVHTDGANLQQFTEPHDHQKRLDHFITQLSDDQVITGYYYPGNNYGYGILLRLELDPDGIDFQREPISQLFTHNLFPVSLREFDRKGTVTITPHTDASDAPAPNLSGKYAMPAATRNNGLLVAYSPGSVNTFAARCAPQNNNGVDLCENLKSGIYLINNASSNEFITDPGQLLKVIDEPGYNEIWPRAVLSYKDIYGQDKPTVIPPVAAANSDQRLAIGEAAALMGTSSMYNREPLNETGEKLDEFAPSVKRPLEGGNWTIQGSDAGIFSNSEIFGVRIVASPPVPYTKTVYSSPRADNNFKRYLVDDRLNNVARRFGSYHGERWEILGEFPLPHKSVTDAQGNPDSSWLAKVPADTPMFIQTIDSRGMTLTSELTWRGLKSGEVRADCGGCHAHSIPLLDFNTTEAGKKAPITNVANVSDGNPIIQDGMWDLTQGSVPLMTDNGVNFQPGYAYGVEFNKDVLPIINNKCVSCHTSGGPGEAMILDGTGPDDDAWAVISLALNPNNTPLISFPQKSRYIRVPQARQSLLAWIVWGERLDGRSNSDRDDDIDYTSAMHDAHIDTVANLTDFEKRTISRWIDLGGAVNFPNDVPNADGFRYTDDYQLPIVNIHSPVPGVNNQNTNLKVGFIDAHSGLNLQSIKVEYYPLSANLLSTIDLSANINQIVSDVETFITKNTQTITIDPVSQVNTKNVLTLNLPNDLRTGEEFVIRISIEDQAGNTGITSTRFSIN